MEYVVHLDSLLQTTSGQDSLHLLVRREHAIDSIESLSLLNSGLVKAVLQARSGAADSLIAQNNAIAVANIWEQNERAVNHIFLNTLAKGIPPNGTQADLLRGIAAQCPYEGGTAVFRARALLDGMVEEHYDDGTACGQDGGQQLIMLPVAGEKAAPMMVYPNPVKKTLAIRFSEEIAKGQKAVIMNPYGQWVQTLDLPQGEVLFTFELADIPSGVYFLKIFGNGQASGTTRLMVVRP